MKKAIRGTCKFITTLAVLFIVAFAVMVVGIKLLGFDVYIVLSPSMEPEIKTGSVIYTQDAVVSELEKGDIITFNIGGGKTATHRIEEVKGSGDNVSFVTKGDANDNIDGTEVKGSDVVGECVFWVPYLGFLVDFIQSKIGMYVSIGVVAFIIILMMLPDILFGEEEKAKKKKKGKSNSDVESNEGDGESAAVGDSAEIIGEAEKEETIEKDN